MVQLTVLDPVSYGRLFFELVQRYHAVLIPNLTDEQPLLCSTLMHGRCQ